MEIADACSFSLERAEIRISGRARPARQDAAAAPRGPDLESARAGATATAFPAKVQAPAAGGARPHRRSSTTRSISSPSTTSSASPRDKGILCQGRGSAANSAVCYCLGITAVDPTRAHAPVRPLHLGGAQRAARHRRRFRARAARGGDPVPLPALRPRPRRDLRHRDPLPPAHGDPRGRQGARPDPRHHRGARRHGLGPAGATASRTSTSARPGSIPTIRPSARRSTSPTSSIGFPRHLSQHVGGFVLSQRRIDETVPIGNAAMEDRTFIEWDKDDIDAVGLMKVDVLALGMLTCIRRGLDFLQAATTGCDYADARRHPAGGARTGLRRCCRGPIPSACSRSRAGRRCRCCRASSRRNSTTSSSRSRSCGQARSRATWCIPTCAAARARQRRAIPRRARPRRSGRAQDGSREDLRRAALPGAGHAHRHRRRRLHAGRGRRPAPRHGDLPAQRQHPRVPRASSSTA